MEPGHPDDDVELFGEVFTEPIYPLYPEEDVACRAEVRCSDFHDPTKYYEISEDTMVSGSDTEQTLHSDGSVHSGPKGEEGNSQPASGLLPSPPFSKWNIPQSRGRMQGCVMSTSH